MDSTPQQTLAANRPRLLGMAWAHFLNDGAANYLPGVLPAILVSMHLSVSYAGLLMAALLIGQAAQPLVGLIADKIGGRAFVIAGLFGTSLGGAAVGFMPNQWTLVIVLLMIGLCNALFHPQAVVGVRALGHDRPGAATSIFLVGGEIGRGIWPVIASWLVLRQGLDALWILSIPAALTLLPLWHWAPPIQSRHKHAAPLNLRAHTRPLSILVGFCSLRALIIYGVVTFMPVLWLQQGGSLTTGASFITVLMLVGIIGNLGGGRLGDRIGKRPVVIGGIIAAVLLLIAFLQVSGLMVWILLALLGIALFATLPLTILIAQDILPENPSLGSGLALGFANAVGAVCVIALGPIADAWGAQMAIWVTVICGLAAIPLAMKLPTHDQQ